MTKVRKWCKLDLVTIWIKVACTVPSSALYSISPNPPPESGREVTAVADGVAAVPATKAPTPVLEAHVANFNYRVRIPDADEDANEDADENDPTPEIRLGSGSKCRVR